MRAHGSRSMGKGLRVGGGGEHQWGLSWRDRPPAAARRPQALCDFHTGTLCESQKSDFWGGFCRRQRPMIGNRAWKSRKSDFWGGVCRRQRPMTGNRAWKSQKSDFWGGFCRRQRPLIETELGFGPQRAQGASRGPTAPHGAPLGPHGGPRGPRGPVHRGFPYCPTWPAGGCP